MLSKFHVICLETAKKYQSNLKRQNFDTNQILYVHGHCIQIQGAECVGIGKNKKRAMLGESISDPKRLKVYLSCSLKAAAKTTKRNRNM
jgi:hypothetical protein